MHSRADVLAALEDIISAAPETVAECTYFEWEPGSTEATPVCVVGHLINRLEPSTFQVMTEADVTSEGEVAGVVIENLRQVGIHLSFENDRDLIFALGVLQGEQDQGSTWAEAYKSFKTTLAQLDRNAGVTS